MLRRAVTITNVTLATKDETSRGVAKACLLSVADVGTILQVVVKPRKQTQACMHLFDLESIFQRRVHQ